MFSGKVMEANYNYICSDINTKGNKYNCKNIELCNSLKIKIEFIILSQDRKKHIQNLKHCLNYVIYGGAINFLP